MTALAPPPVEQAVETLRPYKGLDFYEATELDARLFVGRENERKLIASNLIASRLTILYGPSGVGKSSLLHAGVAYQLRREAELTERGTPEYVVVTFRSWSDDPVADLLAKVVEEVTAIAPGVEPDAVPPGLPLAGALREWGAGVGCELLVILDQFEEYFLYHGEQASADEFAGQFADAVNDPSAHANFLVSIREDALAKLDRFKERIPNLFNSYLRLDRLGTRAGQEAIEQPLVEWSRLPGHEPVSIEPELVAEVLIQVRAEAADEGRGEVEDGEAPSSPTAIEAPYLQLVLESVWDAEREAGSNVLRLETLREKLGGAQRIVDRRVEEAMGSLAADDQEVAAQVCHFLVSRAGTKIAFSAQDLAGFAELPQADVARVLEQLAGQKQRILRPLATSRNQPGGSRYELFHDKLAPAVLAWRARFIEEQARHEAKAQLDAERAQRRRKTINRLVSWAAFLLVLLAAGLAALVWWALNQRAEARSGERAVLANQQLEIDPARSVELAAEAVGIRATGQAADALRAALAESHLREVIGERDRDVLAVGFSRDGKRILTVRGEGTITVGTAENTVLARRPDAGMVDAAAFSRDGTRVVMLEKGIALVLAIPDGGLLATLVDPASSISAASFSPDGRRVLTVSNDGRARIWPTTGAEPLVLSRTPDEAISAAAFSVDGERVVTGTDTGNAWIWRAADGRPESVLKGPATVVRAVSFGPHGTRVVTGGADGTVGLSSLVKGTWTSRTLRAHTGALLAVGFSPDGGHVVTASEDGTAGLWRTSSLQSLVVLRGHTGKVTTAIFSPDGTQVVTVSADGTARLWQVPRDRPSSVLPGHMGSLLSAAAFSNDGELVVTAAVGEDRARLWETRSGLRRTQFGLRDAAFATTDGNLVLMTNSNEQGEVREVSSGDGVPLRGVGGALQTAALSPDGKRLVTTNTDGSARLWKTSTGRDVGRIAATGKAILTAAFSPDGERVVTTALDDSEAHVWEGSSGRKVFDLDGHLRPVKTAFFSPDGGRIVTASDDRTARVWDSSSGRELRVLRGHEDAVLSARFDRDGRRIVTASNDGTARVWDASSGERVAILEHGGLVRDAAFNRDGTLVVTSGDDKTARVWLASSGRSLAVLRGHRQNVVSAAFSPDGRLVLTASADGNARLFACAVCGPLDDLRKLAARVPRSG